MSELNGKKCQECGTELTGRKSKWCNVGCSDAKWDRIYKENAERKQQRTRELLAGPVPEPMTPAYLKATAEDQGAYNRGNKFMVAGVEYVVKVGLAGLGPRKRNGNPRSRDEYLYYVPTSTTGTKRSPAQGGA